MSKRDPFFDNVKIMLMILVVLGHILPQGFSHKSCFISYEWIFAFHMPLFIFISGYFTKITTKRKFWKGILQLSETFIVFMVIHIIIMLLQHKHFGAYMIFIPRWTLWYILSLIFWRLMLFFSPKRILENNALLIIIALLFCLAMGFVPINKILSFQRTFSFLPFFILGYIAGKEHIIHKLHIHPIMAVVILISMAGILYFCNLQHELFSLNHCYYDDSNHFQPFVLLFRIGYLFVASLMSLCMLSVTPKKEYRWTHFGQLTLFIYIWHSVILAWRHLIHQNLPTSLPFCLIYTVIVLGIIYCMSKINFFHWLLNPVSKSMDYIKKKEGINKTQSDAPK